jgi:myosin heavy subunit
MSKKIEDKTNTNWMLPGRKCWVEQPSAEGTEEEIFLPGKILNSDVAEKIQVMVVKNGAESAAEATASLIHEANEDIDEKGIDDMVNMACMNEAELVSNIRRRYKGDNIFTYIGPTLLVLNPYKSVAHEFTESKLKAYEDQVRNSEVFQLKDNPPHVFAISALAYRQLFENNRNQAIVISGESGAGKTENAKYAMMFLTSLSKDKNQQQQQKKGMIKQLKYNK